MDPADDTILSALFEVAPDALILTDASGHILRGSPATAGLFGYDGTELAGRSIALLFPEVDVGLLAAAAGETLSWPARRNDGTPIRVEVRVTAQRDHAGTPAGYLVWARGVAGQNEDRFRALAETASDGILAVDTTSTILFANEGAGRIFGYRAAELVGRDLTQLMPEYLRHLHRAGMQHYLETGVRHIHWASTELPGLHRDGHIVPLEISFGESRSGGQHIFTGVIRDITVRKRIERRLTIEHTVAQVLAGATSEGEVLGAILEALGRALGWSWGAIWVRDESRTAMRCTDTWSADAANEPFARRSSEIRLALGEGLPGRVWASGSPAWVSDVVSDTNFPRAPQARLAGLHAAVAFPIQRRGETHAVMEFLASRVEEPDPELLGLMTAVGAQVGQFLERRRAEAALRRSEERYRSLVQATAQLVWSCDPDGNIVEELPSWSRYTGQPFEAYRGRGWLEAVHPDDRNALLAAWRAAVASQQPLRETEARIRRSDGVYGIFAIRGVPILSAAGLPAEWVGTCTDITARREQEERLRQADRMEAVGRLAGGVAHEANNQMSVVLGSAEFVLRRPDLPEAVRQDVDFIRQAAERTAAITAQLLAFGRRQVLQPKLLALDAEVARLEPLLRRTLGEGHTLVVNAEAAEDERRVRADPGQLAQVLLNLTFNARDAMPEGGTLTIRTRSVTLTAEQAAARREEGVLPGAYAVLTVSDSGYGMDRETLARAFEPFFTTKPIGQGTGLGLSSVHGIVRQSGGQIWAHSEPGLGATFEIYLPLAEPQAREADLPEPEAAVRGTGTVLVAEDEPVLRAMMARALREVGFTVLEAAEGQEALEMARAHADDLQVVVVDVVMPRMNGWALVHRLRQDRPDLRALFISGFPDVESRERGLVEGGEPMLQKPFAPATLVREVVKLAKERT